MICTGDATQNANFNCSFGLQLSYINTAFHTCWDCKQYAVGMLCCWCWRHLVLAFRRTEQRVAQYYCWCVSGHARSHTVSVSDCNTTAVLNRHISLWVRQDDGGNDLASWSAPCPVDWPAPFRHFSITAAAAAAQLHNHRWSPPTRRTNEKSLRGDRAPAVPKKWTTTASRAATSPEKLNLSDELRRLVERQLRDSVCVAASRDTYVLCMRVWRRTYTYTYVHVRSVRVCTWRKATALYWRMKDSVPRLQTSFTAAPRLTIRIRWIAGLQPNENLYSP